MLDPRSLAERREEIAASCRRRGIAADVDGAVALQAQVAAKQTELNEANRRRNEHQEAGKRLPVAERAAHGLEGRALKEAVSRIEAELAGLRARFDEALARLPNFIHPAVPDGGEDDARELRRVGEPRRFDFQPLDHVELGARLDLIDFDGGARVAGQKFYYLKNEAVLLELALQRFAIDVPGFETRRVNLTLRYVPDEHVVPYAALPAPARTQIRRYVERLATRSAYWARCLADVAI